MIMFEKSRANKIYRKVNELKSQCSERLLFDATSPLERVAIVAKSPNTKITFKNYRLAKKCLNSIGSTLDKQHIYKIKYECEKACNILLNKYTKASNEEDIIMKNNAELIDLQDTISSIDKSIAVNKEMMNKVLGKDEMAWKRLNATNKILTQKRALYKKQFDNSVIFLQNLEICNDAKMIREKYTSNIVKNYDSVNTDEFAENMDTINYVDGEVMKQNEIITQKIYDSVDDTVDDEYRKACEAKMMEEMARQEASKSINTMNLTSEQVPVFNDK